MDRPIILEDAPSSSSSLLRVMSKRHPRIAGRSGIAIFDKPGLYEESPASFRKNIGRWLDRGYPDIYVGGAPALFMSRTAPSESSSGQLFYQIFLSCSPA